MKRQYKYPEIPKIESELDSLIKQTELEIKRLEDLIKQITAGQTGGGGGGVNIVGDTFSAANSDEFLLRKAVDSYNYYKFKYQNLISQLNSIYAQATHTHNKSDITGLNEGLVGTKEVNETDIADGKILQYDNASGNLIYVPKPSGFKETWVYDLRWNAGTASNLFLNWTGSAFSSDWNDSAFPITMRAAILFRAQTVGQQFSYTLYCLKACTVHIYVDFALNFNLSDVRLYDGGLVGNTLSGYSSSPNAVLKFDTGYEKSVTFGANTFTFQTVVARSYFAIKKLWLVEV